MTGGGAVLHERQLYVYPRGPGDAPGNQWVCSCGRIWPCALITHDTQGSRGRELLRERQAEVRQLKADFAAFKATSAESFAPPASYCACGDPMDDLGRCTNEHCSHFGDRDRHAKIVTLDSERAARLKMEEALRGMLDQPETPESYDAMIARAQAALAAR